LDNFYDGNRKRRTAVYKKLDVDYDEYSEEEMKIEIYYDYKDCEKADLNDLKINPLPYVNPSNTNIWKPIKFLNNQDEKKKIFDKATYKYKEKIL